MVLGIDPSTSSLGWAVYDRPLTPIGDGFVAFEFDAPLDYLTQLTDLLDHLAAEYQITEVVTEAMFISKFRNSNASLLNVSVKQIEAWCKVARVPFTKYANNTVKKAVTGNHKADKRAVLFAVKEYLSRTSQELPVPKGKNEVAHIFDVADAHAIAQTYLARNKRTPRPKVT